MRRIIILIIAVSFIVTSFNCNSKAMEDLYTCSWGQMIIENRTVNGNIYSTLKTISGNTILEEDARMLSFIQYNNDLAFLVAVYQTTFYAGTEKYALCSKDGMLTDFIFSHLEVNIESCELPILCATSEAPYLYGFIDEIGNWVIEPQFFHAIPFQNGIAYVEKEVPDSDETDKYFINTKGDIQSYLIDTFDTLSRVSLYDCIKSYSVDIDSALFSARNGVLYSKDFSTLYAYPQYKEGSMFFVPTSVIKIAGVGFSSAAYLKELIIPESVEVIEIGTLNAAQIEKLVLLGNTAFYIDDISSLSSLKELVIQKGSISEEIIQLNQDYIPLGVSIQYIGS